MRSVVMLVLILAGFCSKLEAQFALERSRKSESLSFTMIKNLVIIPLTINGRGPFNFVLDTGVGIFLVTDPSLADTLRLTNLKNITITGFGEGQQLNAYVCPSLEVRIGNHISSRMAAAILQEDAFDLSAYTGIPVHGLLGYEFFSSFVVKLSYSAKTLKVYSPEVLYIPRKGSKVPITVEEGKPYLNARIQLEGNSWIKAKLIMDTGAGHPLSLETFEGRPFKVPEKNIRANLGVGLMGAISGYLGRVPKLEIGKYAMQDVLAAFPDYETVGARVSSITRNGNIGNGILKRFDIVFDYNHSHIYLKPNYYYRQAFEHDMSGLELLAGGEGLKRIFIARVEPGSPGAEAGLVPGDEIVSVNLRPVKEMDMEEIYSLFRSGKERGILLNVLRAEEKKPQLLIIYLKRRI